MQKYLPFFEVPDVMIMFPDGSLHTKAETAEIYTILATDMGVIGVTANDDGSLTNPVCMASYDNINVLTPSFSSMGCDFSAAKTISEKCAVITDFVNNPVNEEEEAIETYLSL